MHNSVWTENSPMPRFPRLDRDLKTDVLIIGGGIAGILCAWQLQRRGVDCVLIEADRLCRGITRNTTAKITAQHGLIYDKLLRQHGAETALGYWEINSLALKEYKALATGIDCDFEIRDNYIYSRDDRKKLERELNALEMLGIPGEFAEDLPLPVPTVGAVRFRNQAQFHPLKFLLHLAKDLRVFEETPAREFVGSTVITDRGQITASKIIVATHFPMLNKHGSYFLKLYQDRSYVLAMENAQDLNGMYLDAERGGFSFRNYGELLLLGGGSHRTGKKSEGWQELERFQARYYPHAVVKYRWAAQDCMSLDGMPYIGRYSSRTQDLYVATGFNKWGMTSSMAASMILCDLVQGRENPYASVFSPSRSILRPQLLCNAAESTVNLLTPTAPRCPHLGCALKWNPQEHSWDCPCHGSRFTGDGKLLDNPATGDLKRKP